MSKVFQGVMQAKHELLDSKEQIVILWVHECLRVYSDRLNDERDKQWFRCVPRLDAFGAPTCAAAVVLITSNPKQ